MCTIIAALGVWPEAPLVIAANRDELLDRPAAGPRLWSSGSACERAVLAPVDLVAGGTWLGVNDRGLFVGITNRQAPIDASRRSRGELVFRALGAADHREAKARMLELDAAAYNPFHLLMADRQGAAIVWGDGRRLHVQEVGPGIHGLTERSFDAAPSRRHELIEQLAELDEDGPPTPQRWRSILADHRPHGEPHPRTVGFDAMCVHADPHNYGTRSSTLLELRAELGTSRFLHAPGRPCHTEFVDHASELRELFGGSP